MSANFTEMELSPEELEARDHVIELLQLIEPLGQIDAADRQRATNLALAIETLAGNHPDSELIDIAPQTSRAFLGGATATSMGLHP